MVLVLHLPNEDSIEEFCSVEWVLKQICECHLLLLYGYLAMLVIVVFHGCCCGLELVFAYFPWQLVPWMLDCSKEVLMLESTLMIQEVCLVPSSL